jgi:hypothetical protein
MFVLTSLDGTNRIIKHAKVTCLIVTEVDEMLLAGWMNQIT